MTLVEVLIALGIGASIATVITLVTSTGLKNMRSGRRAERVQANAIFISDIAAYWIKQGEFFSIAASPPKLEITLPDASIKIIRLQNNRVTLDGAAITSDDVRVTYLHFKRLARSIRVGFTLQAQGGAENFSATTTIAQRNTL